MLTTQASCLPEITYFIAALIYPRKKAQMKCPTGRPQHIVSKSKTPKIPSIGTGIKKEKKNTLEYYTEDQNNELDLHVVTWTDVKTKIWSEKSQCKSENISTQSFQKAWQLRNKNSFLHRESSCCLPFLSYFFPGK